MDLVQASMLLSDEQKTARIARHLHQAALFGGLDDEALAGVARLARALAYQRGAQLNEPATAAGSIYVVVEGRLRVYQQSPTDREVTLGLMEPGEAFRFLAREPHGAPTSVAKALAPRTAIYRFPGPALLEALTAHPAAALRLVAECERTLALAHASLVEVVLYDVETRLARLLVRLAGEEANSRGEGYVGVTHEELAWRVNASRVEVSRLVRHFTLLELVETDLHHHGILVRPSLADHARYLASRQRDEPRTRERQPSP